MSSKTTGVQDRLQWVDQTKGLAILAIILFHFFQNYPERIHLVTSLDRNGARLGYAAVDIFFIMAGFNTSYVITSSSQKDWIKLFNIDWKSWLKKRLLRLYPTYILAVICSVSLYYLFGRLEIRNVFNFILSCMGLAGYKFQAINPGFWFFTVILQAYLVTPIIFYICKSKPQNFLLLGITVGCLNKLACFAVSSNSEAFLFLLQDNFLGSYFFQLCLGLYWGFIFANNQVFRKVDFTIATGVFLVGLIVYFTMVISKIKIIYMLGFDLVFTPLFFLLSYLIFDYLATKEWLNKRLNFFSLIGVYSYQIYLIHQPLYFSLLKYMAKYISINSYLKMGIILVIILTIIGGYTYLFVKLETFLRKFLEKLIKQT